MATRSDIDRYFKHAFPPFELGDSQDVVVTLHLNREGLKWLAYDVMDRENVREDTAAYEIIVAQHRVEQLDADAAEDERIASEL